MSVFSFTVLKKFINLVVGLKYLFHLQLILRYRLYLFNLMLVKTTAAGLKASMSLADGFKISA